MQRILIAAVLFLTLPAAMAQAEAEPSPGLEALEAARKAREEKMDKLGFKDGQVVIQGKKGEVDIEKMIKTITTEMPKIQKAWLNDLKELSEKFPSDPAINKIRWEYVNALFQQGKGKDARQVLALLGPSGLDLEERLSVVQLLVSLGMEEKAATLLAGMEADAIAQDRNRHLVLAVLAATGQKSRALQGLEPEFEGVEDGEEMWEIIDDLEKRFLMFPPSLHRPLLAALYARCLERFPAEAEPGRKETMAGLLMKTGSPAIPLAGPDLAGKERNLTEFKGKVLLIHFWASWNKATMEELDGLKKLVKEFGPKGFAILGVSLDRPAATAERAAEENKLPWPSLCDGKTWQSEFVTKYAVKRMPFSVLLDREGKVAGLGLGGKDLEARIRDLL